MVAKHTRALGVLLRKPVKFRSQVRIGLITHAYNNGWVKAQTLCGINYTHKKHLAYDKTALAVRTSRDVDCMTCLVLR